MIDRLKNIFKNQKFKLSNNLYFIKGDVRNITDLEKVFLKIQENGDSINGVIHFSGLKAIDESLKFPLCYWYTNLVGTITLLKVMKKFNC